MSQAQITAYFCHSGGLIIPAEVKAWCARAPPTDLPVSVGREAAYFLIFASEIPNQFSKLCHRITDAPKRILRTLSFSRLKWVQHITGNIPGSPWTYIVIYSPFSTVSTLRPSEVEFRTSAEWNPTSMNWLGRFGVWLRKFDAKNE